MLSEGVVVGVTLGEHAIKTTVVQKAEMIIFFIFLFLI